MSDIQPQKAWHWYSKELIFYPMLNGRINKGILYKPEDLDSLKKYPVIFQYYDQLSQQYYEFDKPKLSKGAVDPAWMCSRGYIVFQPDIPRDTGMVGESAYIAVVGAAKYLETKSWVDSTKMGLSGSSHGGFLTNYLVTRTNLFAAAAPSCGID